MKTIKPYCAWCWLPLALDEKRYEDDGNICRRCSARCSEVVAGNKTEREADKELRWERSKNDNIYKTSNIITQ